MYLKYPVLVLVLVDLQSSSPPLVRSGWWPKPLASTLLGDTEQWKYLTLWTTVQILGEPLTRLLALSLKVDPTDFLIGF